MSFLRHRDLFPDGHWNCNLVQREPQPEFPPFPIGTMSRSSIPGRVLSSRACFRFLDPKSVTDVVRTLCNACRETKHLKACSTPFSFTPFTKPV